MRPLTVVGLFAILLATGACKRSARHVAPAELLSVLPMDHPSAGAQLVHGFYVLEEDKWRWTSSRFGVILRPPTAQGDSAQDGARLELMLTIPDVVVRELGSVTLSATAAQSPLAPEKYTKAGDYVYARDVPASALGGASVSIEFVTDKAIPAGKIEQRELALVVTSVGLVPKPAN
jgi:hypothetical protein